MIRLMIADDQNLFADMLKTVLNSNPDITVEAYAKNGAEAFEIYQKMRPDVCLLDIQMPSGGGLEALKKIKELDPSSRVIMLTIFGNSDNIFNAFLSGADGYLLKDLQPSTLTEAIRCVHNGLSVMNSDVRTQLSEKLKYFMGEPKNNTNLLTNDFDKRDIQIMRLIAEGLSNRLIAEKLNYSEGTIRNRISMILAETGLTDRTQLALFAIKNRLV